MKTFYELMDMASANVVGFYDTEEDALNAVHAAFVQHGLSGVEDLALSRKSGRVRPVLIAEGAALLRCSPDKDSHSSSQDQNAAVSAERGRRVGQ